MLLREDSAVCSIRSRRGEIAIARRARLTAGDIATYLVVSTFGADVELESDLEAERACSFRRSLSAVVSSDVEAGDFDRLAILRRMEPYSSGSWNPSSIDTYLRLRSEGTASCWSRPTPPTPS